jgi:phosphohistidine phosphatase
MILYFLRHGEAVDAAGYKDSERPLSETGIEQAAAAARFFKGRGLQLDCILSSPLVRAQQTAEAVQKLLGLASLRVTDNLLSSSDPRATLRELQTLKSDNLLLVGHQPHLGRTISLLLGLEDRSRVEMKSGSLARVSTVSSPEPGQGVLQWLLPSGEMRR